MTTPFIRKSVGNDAMLYDVERDAVHILNPTADLIRQLAGEGLKEEAIADELRRRFRIEGEDRVLEDVRECLRTLAERDLKA